MVDVLWQGRAMILLAEDVETNAVRGEGERSFLTQTREVRPIS